VCVCVCVCVLLCFWGHSRQKTRFQDSYLLSGGDTYIALQGATHIVLYGDAYIQSYKGIHISLAMLIFIRKGPVRDYTYACIRG